MVKSHEKVEKIAIYLHFMLTDPFVLASQHLTKYQYIAVIYFLLQTVKEGTVRNSSLCINLVL